MANTTNAPRAVGARYDRAGRRVLVELTNGYAIGIPVAQLPEVAAAPASQLAAVEIIGAGNILHWEALDADYSVAALVARAVGRAAAARELGRVGGRVTSDAKTKAARKNGKRGGRPRKTSA